MADCEDGGLAQQDEEMEDNALENESSEEEEEEEKEEEDEEGEAGLGFEVFEHQPLTQTMQALLLGLGGDAEDRRLEAMADMHKLLASPDGGRVLHQYVLSSPKCAELVAIWQSGSRAATALPLLRLMAQMLRHRMGRGYSAPAVDGYSLFENEEGHAGVEDDVSDPLFRRRLLAVQLRLDKLAHTIVQSKLKDIYSHLSSGQNRRENAALQLMCAIVLRGRILAKEVGTKFDFTLEALRKLGRHLHKRKASNNAKDKVGQPTRKAFVQFAMAFVLVGDASLLRWVLQKRVLYAGVLHGLAKDDEFIIVDVLKLMKLKVLDSNAQVPSGIQCAMFGDAALDQLAQITSDESLSAVARDTAYSSLLALCTEPGHGLCLDYSKDWETQHRRSDTSFRGEKRLLRLMLRLKATEVDMHKELLLAIATNRTSLAAAYINQFPFSLEPRNTPSWFKAVALLSRLMAITNLPSSFLSMSDINLSLPPPDSPLVESSLRRIWPHSFSRAAMNRGLLHPDLFVKHACLVLLLESLSSLEGLQNALKRAAVPISTEGPLHWDNSHVNVRACLQDVDISPVDMNSHGMVATSSEVPLVDEREKTKSGLFYSEEKIYNRQQQWLDLAHHLEDRMRALLPDTRTILSMFSSLRLMDGGTEKAAERDKKNASSCSTEGIKCAKRKKVSRTDGDSIQVVGVKNFSATDGVETLVDEDAAAEVVYDENLGACSIAVEDNINEELYIKVLQVLAAFQRALPTTLADHNFNAFKMVPENTKVLSGRQQRALVDLLQAATGSSDVSMLDPCEYSASSVTLHKNFKPLLNLMFYAHEKEVKAQATILAHRAMVSTGAFDNNISEVALWLSFLTFGDGEGYNEEENHLNLKSTTSPTVFATSFHENLMGFLWDAVFSVGKNLYKYLDQLHSVLSHMLHSINGCSAESAGGTEGFATADFGPFVVCTLDKYTRLIRSSSKAMKLPERAAVGIYLVNVLRTLLQAQANPKKLAGVICSLLSGDLLEYVSGNKLEKNFSCDWSPLVRLFAYAESRCPKLRNSLNNMQLELYYSSQESIDGGHLLELMEACITCQVEDSSAIATALARSLVCVSPEEVVKNFPWVLGVCRHFFRGDFSVLAAILNANGGMMSEIHREWPDLFKFEIFSNGSSKVASYEVPSGEFFRYLGCTENLDKVSSPGSCSYVVSGFGAFLKCLSFFDLFSACASSTDTKLLTLPFIRDCIQASLFRLTCVEMIPAAQVVIFWIGELLKLKDFEEIEAQLETCFTYLRQILLPSDHTVWWEQIGRSISFFKQLITSAFNNPVLLEHFLFPKGGKEKQSYLELWKSLLLKAVTQEEVGEKRDTLFGRNLEDCIIVQRLHPFDRHLVEIVKNLLSMCSSPQVPALSSWSMETMYGILSHIQSSCRPLVARAFDSLGNHFKKEPKYNDKLDLVNVSALYAVLEWSQYTEPFYLVFFLTQILSQYTMDHSVIKKETCPSKQSLGLFLARTLFKMLSSSSSMSEYYFKSSVWWPLDQKGKYFHSKDLVPIFTVVLELFITTPVDNAASCILSALNIMDLKHDSHIPKFCEMPSEQFPEFVTLISAEVLMACMKNTTKLKAELALTIIRMSPIHLSEFGRLITLAVNEHDSNLAELTKLSTMLLSAGKPKLDTGSFSLSNNDLMLLLPAVHFYLTCKKIPQAMASSKVHYIVQSVYRKFFIRLMKKWNMEFDIFGPEIVFDGFPSERDLLGLQSGYLCSEKFFLGKALAVLHECLSTQPLTEKKRYALFSCLLPKSGTLISNLNSTCGELKKGVINIVARSAFLLSLISSDILSVLRNTISPIELFKGDVDSENLVCSKDNSMIKEDMLSYFNTMVDFLHTILQPKFFGYRGVLQPPVSGASPEDNLIHILQGNIFTHLLIVSRYMRTFQWGENFAETLKLFTQMVLRHRFGDYLATVTLRSLFSCLRPIEMPVSTAAHNLAESVLELVVTHSQFVPFLLCKKDPTVQGLEAEGPIPSLSSTLGLVSSIEAQTKVESSSPKRSGECFGVCFRQESKVRNTEAEINEFFFNGKVELVKLLRVLYSLKRPGIMSSSSISSEELLSLLLGTYDASMSGLDTEILALMHEIESSEDQNFIGLSGIDFLWGEAAFKRRDMRLQLKERQHMSPLDMESMEDVRKRIVKEDLRIDPRKCGSTVLHFPTKRSVWVPASKPNEEHQVGSKDKLIASTEGTLGIALYDPAFILPFSLHSLSIGSIDVEDFTSWGLLAIAFASTSSDSEETRKLGYEILSTLMRNLQEGSSFKGKPQIQMLLIFFKNAITEPWQKIPRVFALFAAEASCILMHPESPYYLTINRFLLREPGMDLQNVPLYHKMFGSRSTEFRFERTWVLNLLAFGLISSLDARVYRHQFLLEMLMSFFSCSMSDGHTRKQILQVVKQAAKLPSYSLHLVFTCGLLSWLASAVVNRFVFRSAKHSDADTYEVSATALQVIEILLNSRQLKKKLLTEGMEELCKVAVMLHQFMVENYQSGHCYLNYKRPILRIILAVLRLSNRQTKYRIHFGLSLQALKEIIQWVEVTGSSDVTVVNEIRILALWTILQSSPVPVLTWQDKEIFHFVLRWATMVILLVIQINSTSITLTSENACTPEEKLDSSLLVEVLLQWTSRALFSGRLLNNAHSEERLFSQKKENFLHLGSFIMFSESHAASVDERLSSLIMLLHKVSHACGYGGSMEAAVNALVSLGLRIQPSCPLAFCEERPSTPGMGSVGSCTIAYNILKVLLEEIRCPQISDSFSHWSVCSPWEGSPQDSLSGSSSFYEYEVRKTVLSIYQQIATQASNIDHFLIKLRASANLFLKSSSERDVENEFLGQDAVKSLQKLKTKILHLISEIPL